jgi:hypothetical protein
MKYKKGYIGGNTYYYVINADGSENYYSATLNYFWLFACLIISVIFAVLFYSANPLLSLVGLAMGPMSMMPTYYNPLWQWNQMDYLGSSKETNIGELMKRREQDRS